MKSIRTAVIIAGTLLAGTVAVWAADEHLTLTAGKSIIIDSPGDVERVAVATEDIVEAVAVSQREVVLNGKAPGETSVIIWRRNGGGRQQYDVTVQPSPTRVEALRERIKKEVGDSIQADIDDKSVMLHGQVLNQQDGDRVMAIASAFGKPVNLMTVATPAAVPQILLKVRFADVDRTASLNLGANIFSTGAGKTNGSLSTQQFPSPGPNSPIAAGTSQTFNLSNALNVFLFRPDLNLGATIEALEAKNLVQILAEPNVLATVGKQASFLAGGEFPYPVVQSAANGINNVTIQFREFGIRLNFTPTITPRGTIVLEVAPEVSSLDYVNGLTYNGFNIPGLSVRRIKTEIELQNNQSFAIAGLLDNTMTENLSKVPGLGDIPLLGKLFQSRATTRNHSELLVVVTPEVVQPIPAGTVPPGINMPREFMKDSGSLTPTEYNVHESNPLPVQSSVAFAPAEQKPAAAEASTSAADAISAITGSLKKAK